MDYSTEYVTMCEKATELQESVEDREITEKDFHAKKAGKGKVADLLIWLPRFDQIQDTLISIRTQGLDGETPDFGRNQVGEFIEDVHSSYVKNADLFTLEQAALCLYMKEVYFKYWNIIKKEWEER